MTELESKNRRTWRRYAVLFGIALGLVCKSLPHEYQGPCNIVVSICTGSF